MSRKRLASEADLAAQRPRRGSVKRARVSRSDNDRSDSSLPSTCSVSEASAMRSSPGAADHASDSSASSLAEASDTESSTSDTTEESSDAELEEELVVTIGRPKKPVIQMTAVADGAQDLQARISALLPQILAANDELGRAGGGCSIEDVKDGEQHIEMNLGLQP